MNAYVIKVLDIEDIVEPIVMEEVTVIAETAVQALHVAYEHAEIAYPNINKMVDAKPW